MDDTSGWHGVLLELWSDALCERVVTRIEQVTVGRRGWLVRVFADPEGVRGEFTETVHALILAAIRDETGADLDELGSQAAWECYEQVWDGLARRWADGGELATVPLGQEPDVVRRLASLPAEAAAHAGADVSAGTSDPLWLAGRLRVDADGLCHYLGLDGGRVPAEVYADVTAILAVVDAPRPG